MDVDTARRSAVLIEEAHEFADAIVETLRDPLVVLDPDLRVKKANAMFYKMFQVTPEDTEGRFLSELGDGQWNIPKLRQLLEEILPRNSAFNDFVVEHEFPRIGRKRMLLNARRILGKDNKLKSILLVIEDATRHEAPTSMKKSKPAARVTMKRSGRPPVLKPRPGRSPAAATATTQSKAEFQRVVHELQVHQEELEAQNEELRETQQLLETSRDRYADLYDFAPIGYATLDEKGHIREINLTGATILGRERSRLLGTLFSVAVARDDLNVFHGHLQQCQQGGGPVTTELTLAAHDRDPIPVQLHSVPILDLTGQTTMYRTAITDITERKQAENILRLAHDQLEERVRERTAELAGAVANLRKEISERERAEQGLRELSVRLLQSQDDERRRIARELHDSTGQKLAALAMNLSLIGKSAETLDARLRKALTESLALLDQSSRDIRTLSYLLHPPLLDESGLGAAVRWFADGFSQRSGVQVKLEMAPDLQRFPGEIEMALFRIVQECLTNTHRHSGSSTATIRLVADQNHVQLEMRDSGKGLPKPRSDGYVAPLGVGITGHARTSQTTGRPNGDGERFKGHENRGDSAH